MTTFGVTLNIEETKYFIYTNFDKNLSEELYKSNSLESYLLKSFPEKNVKFSGKKSLQFHEYYKKKIENILSQIPVSQDVSSLINKYIGFQYVNFIYIVKYNYSCVNQIETFKNVYYHRFAGLFIGIELKLLNEDINYNTLFEYKLLIYEFLKFCNIYSSFEDRFIIGGNTNQTSFGFL